VRNADGERQSARQRAREALPKASLEGSLAAAALSVVLILWGIFDWGGMRSRWFVLVVGAIMLPLWLMEAFGAWRDKRHEDR
jgi:hypothetical protein